MIPADIRHFWVIFFTIWHYNLININLYLFHRDRELHEFVKQLTLLITLLNNLFTRMIEIVAINMRFLAWFITAYITGKRTLSIMGTLTSSQHASIASISFPFEQLTLLEQIIYSNELTCGEWGLVSFLIYSHINYRQTDTLRYGSAYE